MKPIYRLVMTFNPKLKHQLVLARMKDSPEKFMKKSLNMAVLVTITVMIGLFMIIDKTGKPFSIVFVGTLIAFFGALWFFVQTPSVYMTKRTKEIDREVLFSARYLLVKIHSGTPLLNTLIDASKGYGVGGKFFKEIVNDVYAGIPLEKAIEYARDTTPSNHFKLILSEILISIKTGVDITQSLRSVIQLITKQQMLEIKEYSKKLGGIVMLYMVIGVVIPSLGIAIFGIMAGFMSLDLTNDIFFFVWLMVIGFVQYMFLSIIRSIRPTVNL